MEQIGLLRRLRTERDRVSDTFHRLPDVGLHRPLDSPIPVPIPIWIGTGGSKRALDRAARIADGLIVPTEQPASELTQVADFREMVERARPDGRHGRSGGTSSARVGRSALLASRARLWRETVAPHVALVGHGSGCRSVDDHVELLRRGRDEIGDVLG